jgi:hypothetical protein
VFDDEKLVTANIGHNFRRSFILAKGTTDLAVFRQHAWDERDEARADMRNDRYLVVKYNGMSQPGAPLQ